MHQGQIETWLAEELHLPDREFARRKRDADDLEEVIRKTREEIESAFAQRGRIKVSVTPVGNE